jgi:hypothetical protein
MLNHYGLKIYKVRDIENSSAISLNVSVFSELN